MTVKEIHLYRELNRTAELFLKNCRKGDYHLAFWLYYDSNRFDPETTKILANKIQEQHLKSKI